MTLFCRNFLRIASIALTLVILALAPASAQTIAVMVNGEPITNYDIDQRAKLTLMSTRKAATRQQVIDELIEEKLKIKEGKKFGVDPSVADIDQSYASMSSRMRITPEQLTKSLEAQGVRPDTLRQRMKADTVWTSLVRGRFKDSLIVGEKDVQAAVETTGQGKEATDAFEYQMRPVVLILPRDAAPATRDARRKEAESLRARVQSCDEANDLFKSMQNSAIREIVTKTSADIPAPLRELLDKTPIGHLTPPEMTKQGVEMVALCARKPTTADTPKKREIRDKMFVEKFEAKSKAYLREVRGAAMIEYR